MNGGSKYGDRRGSRVAGPSPHAVEWLRPATGVTFAFFICLALVAVSGRFLQAQETTEEPTISVTSEEVILDLVVRDKRGRPVRDLRPEEVQVFEEGAKQETRGFRWVEAEAPLVSQAQEGVAAPAATEEPAPDRLRQINLVTLVFDRLGLESRQLARKGALDFLETELRENVRVSVFTINNRLSVLQQFTADRELLKKAVDRATSAHYADFQSESEAIKLQLENRASFLNAAESAVGAVGRGSPPGGGMGANFAEATMAQMTLDILQQTETLQREQQGQSSIFSLIALAREQGRLAGRKTIIHFSEGMHVPPNVEHIFQSAIGMANRANVSIYAVDARGLYTGSRTEQGRDMLRQAARASAGQIYSEFGSAVTREQVFAAETAQASIKMDLEGTLAELAESTGGFLVSNTNDLGVGMRRVAEDIRGYYELSYVPKIKKYDGKFRRISVKVSRKGVSVQARSGYFALPPTTRTARVYPFEYPLLSALETSPLATDFECRVRALRFAGGAEGIDYALAIEVPMSHFKFRRDKKKNLYRTWFSLMALIKDGNGQIVRKLSQDYPLEVPHDKFESFKKRPMIFIRNVNLPPGRYTLETVALDRETGKSAARRSVLIVAPVRQSVALSSLTVVRRLDPPTDNDPDPDGPLRFQRTKIIPNLGHPLQLGPEMGLGLYLAVYPQAGIDEKPQLQLEFIRDGKPIARAVPQLSAPDSEGRIFYLGTLPGNSFVAGRYQVRAVVRQGSSAAEEHVFFTVAP